MMNYDISYQNFVRTNFVITAVCRVMADRQGRPRNSIEDAGYTMEK